MGIFDVIDDCRSKEKSVCLPILNSLFRILSDTFLSCSHSPSASTARRKNILNQVALRQLKESKLPTIIQAPRKLHFEMHILIGRNRHRHPSRRPTEILVQDLIKPSVPCTRIRLHPIDGDVTAEGEYVRDASLQAARPRVADAADPVVEECIGDHGAGEDLFGGGPGVYCPGDGRALLLVVRFDARGPGVAGWRDAERTSAYVEAVGVWEGGY